MLFAGTFTIQIRRAVFGEPNAHGNRKRQLTAPEPLPIYAVAPASQEEPGGHGRRLAVATGWDIYAPPGTQVSAHDVVVLPNMGECEVIGEPEHWAQHIFPLGRDTGGVRFTVQRKQG